MKDETLKRQILEVMAAHSLCVIATVTDDAKPEAAIVGFSQNDDLELIIGTSRQTRKYANVQKNTQVAIVIGDTSAEIQYEGLIRELSAAELDSQLEGHFKKLPGSPKYLEDPNQRWLLVRPTWIRLTVHEEPNRVEEMSFV